MKIVVTDGYTLNPGDLGWDELKSLGEFSYYDRTAVPDIVERCRGADIVVTNKTPFDSGTIAALPNLKMIAVTATGYNIIDTITAKKNGILVANVPEYSTDSVAQHTIALILQLASRISEHTASVAKGDWIRSADWCYTVAPVMELQGKTLGIVGFGRIGRKVASIALALGMRVVFFNKGKKSSMAEDVSLESLFRESDVVSLHCPLTADNESLVNKQMLALMKRSAFLINTSRGPLIDESHLADALKSNRIAGAALDVLRKEPPTADNPLIGLNNCIITPHYAWKSPEARKRLLDATVQNVKQFVEGGTVENIV